MQPFQIMAQGKGGGPGGPPTQVNKLDNMLGSLQSDLNKLGVQTVAKGVCGACCKPIVGQVRGSFPPSSALNADLPGNRNVISGT